MSEPRLKIRLDSPVVLNGGNPFRCDLTISHGEREWKFEGVRVEPSGRRDGDTDDHDLQDK